MDEPAKRCTHPRPHRTGGWDDGVYSQRCDLCGGDTTDPVEGAEAALFLRQLRQTPGRA